MDIIKFFRELFCKKCMEENERLINEIVKLKDGKDFAEKAADYWDNKWPKANITYVARPLPNKKVNVSWDVRNFIWSGNAQLEEIIKENKLKGKNYHETALSCLKWVFRNIKYIPDKKEQGLPEYWLFPCETLKLRRGDCEDGAILLASLMLNAGVPSHRVKLCAGWVKYQGSRTGHAYVIFLRDKGTWCVEDWCYWPTLTPIEKRKEHKDEENYQEIWWTANDEFAWNQHDVMITGRSLK